MKPDSEDKSALFREYSGKTHTHTQKRKYTHYGYRRRKKEGYHCPGQKRVLRSYVTIVPSAGKIKDDT